MSDLPKPNLEVPARPRPRYDLVFIFLIFFTALEVATSYLQSGLRIPILIAIALVKATLVVLYFMHLKTDHRIFALFFLLGLAFVVPILIMMTIVMPGL